MSRIICSNFSLYIPTKLGSSQFNNKEFKENLNKGLFKILDKKDITKLSPHNWGYVKFSVSLIFYLGSSNYDIDNLCKQVLDVLKYYMGHDDMSIYILKAKKVERRKPGVCIKVKELSS